MISYLQARDKIKTGDLIGVDTRNVFTRFFQRISQFSYGGNKNADMTHVGIALWSAGHLYIFEMDGRFNVLRALSQYTDYKMKVFKTNAVTGNVENAIDCLIGKRIGYDTPSFLTIGARILTGAAFKSDSKKLVCSELALKVLVSAGIIFEKSFPKNPTPGELCNAFKLSLEINYAQT